MDAARVKNSKYESYFHADSAGKQGNIEALI